MKKIIFAVIGLAVVIGVILKIKSCSTPKCPNCKGTGVSHTEYYPVEDIDVEVPCQVCTTK